MEGDATGLNNLAGLGLLNNDNSIYYAGTLAGDPSQLKQLAGQGAQLVLTDTNRKQAFQWASMTANAGFTETPSDDPAKTDPRDSPIDLFPDAGLSSKTVASYAGRGQHHGQQLRKRHHLQPRVRRLAAPSTTTSTRPGSRAPSSPTRPASGGRRNSRTPSRRTTSRSSNRSGATARA